LLVFLPPAPDFSNFLTSTYLIVAYSFLANILNSYDPDFDLFLSPFPSIYSPSFNFDDELDLIKFIFANHGLS